MQAYTKLMKLKFEMHVRVYVLTIDDDSYGYQKKKPAFTLSEKKYPVFQAVEKKYPGFLAEEKKKTVSPKITQAPPRNSNGPSLKN